MDIKYKAYLLSDDWAQLKIDLFDLRGYVCERCTNKSRLHVHHLHYRNIFNEEPEDLIILCKSCHDKEHGIIKSIKKRKKKIKPKYNRKVKTKVKKPKKIKKKPTMSFVKEGNTTMVITRKPI